LRAILEQVPKALLLDRVRPVEFASAAEARKRYLHYLTTRLRAPRTFVAAAEEARDQLRRSPPRRLMARR
jgi:hypothetical protein